MDNLLSLESVRVELKRRGLPSKYVERVVGELQDHRADIVEEQRSTCPDGRAADLLAAQRLGDPKALADLVVSQYRARSFSGRHPVVTFLLAPIPLTILAWVAFVVICLALVNVVSRILGDSIVAHPAVAWGAWSLYYAGMFVPPAITTVILCRLASRSGRGWPWMCAACALVALLALVYQSSLRLPVEPGTGHFTIGLGLSSQPFHFPQVLQMLVPIVIGVFFLWRFQSRRRILLPL